MAERDTRRQANAMISPGSMSSFAEARGDYIGSPQGQNALQQLSNSLSGFEPALRQYVKAEQDNQIRTGTAEGNRYWLENQIEWADFSAQNPDLAGNNPWVEVGYRLAHAKASGLKLDNDLLAWYQDSGVRNIVDPQEAQALIDAKTMELIQAYAGSDQIPSARIFSDAFAPAIEAAQSRIYNQYAQDRGQQQMAYLAQSAETLVGEELLSAIANTPDIYNPEVFSTAMNEYISQMEFDIEQLVMQGLPQTQVADIVSGGIINIAQSLGGDSRGLGADVLQLLDVVTVTDRGGKTVALGEIPSVAAKRESVLRAFRQQEREDIRWNWTVADQRRAEETRRVQSTAGNYILDVLNSTGVAPSLSDLQQVTGASPLDFGTLVSLQSAVVAGTSLSIPETMSNRDLYIQLRHQAAMGNLTYEGVMQHNSALTTPQVNGLLSSINTGSDNPVFNAYKSLDWSRIDRTNKSLVYRNVTRLLPEVDTGVNNIRVTDLNNLVREAMHEYIEQQYSETGRIPSEYELERYALDVGNQLAHLPQFTALGYNSPTVTQGVEGTVRVPTIDEYKADANIAEIIGVQADANSKPDAVYQTPADWSQNTEIYIPFGDLSEEEASYQVLEIIDALLTGPDEQRQEITQVVSNFAGINPNSIEAFLINQAILISPEFNTVEDVIARIAQLRVNTGQPQVQPSTIPVNNQGVEVLLNE